MAFCTWSLQSNEWGATLTRLVKILTVWLTANCAPFLWVPSHEINFLRHFPKTAFLSIWLGRTESWVWFLETFAWTILLAPVLESMCDRLKANNKERAPRNFLLLMVACVQWLTYATALLLTSDKLVAFRFLYFSPICHLPVLVYFMRVRREVLHVKHFPLSICWLAIFLTVVIEHILWHHSMAGKAVPYHQATPWLPFHVPDVFLVMVWPCLYMPIMIVVPDLLGRATSVTWPSQMTQYLLSNYAWQQILKLLLLDAHLIHYPEYPSLIAWLHNWRYIVVLVAVTSLSTHAIEPLGVVLLSCCTCILSKTFIGMFSRSARSIALI